METPDEAAVEGRPSRWPRVVPLLAILVAVTVVGVVALTSIGEDGGGAPPEASQPAEELAEVSSNAPRYETLDELEAASDLVVRGRVRAVERGRWFGDGGDAARIQSRVSTVEITDVLAGDAPEATDLLVEEEGWTEDGRRLVVDGSEPLAVGDEAIWFLVDTGDETSGSWIVVNAQGRYRIADDGSLVGPEGDDPLATELAALGVDALAEQISRTPPRP